LTTEDDAKQAEGTPHRLPRSAQQRFLVGNRRRKKLKDWQPQLSQSLFRTFFPLFRRSESRQSIGMRLLILGDDQIAFQINENIFYEDDSRESLCQFFGNPLYAKLPF
jgi:hypothetical protein